LIIHFIYIHIKFIDEMNLHVPQTEEARAEIANLMYLPYQTMTSQSLRPCIGLVQDGILGWNLITSKNTFIDKMDFMNYLMESPRLLNVPHPAIMVKNSKTGKMDPLWTGKQLFSTLIPEKTNLNKYVRGSSSQKDQWIDFDQSERHVYIHNGELLLGSLCKQTLGASSNSIVQVLCNDVDDQGFESTHFLNTMGRIANKYLMTYGFSFLMSDCYATNEMKTHLNSLFSSVRNNLKELKTFANEEKMPDFITEGVSNRLLHTVRDAASMVLQRELSLKNTFRLMVNCGSKGNIINLVQMILCLGQQTCHGERMGSEFKNGPLLKHFESTSDDPACFGFIENSYVSGLTPSQFLFDAIAGREGLVNTAVKTAGT